MIAVDRLFGRLLHLPPVTAAALRAVQTQPLTVPMDDGVMLQADRYFVGDRPGDPVVLLRGPYGRTGVTAALGRAYAARGLQAVVVSCRGTFGSAGQWYPMRDEAPDGLATWKWLRGQRWFPGTAVLAGPSYLGYTQWALATQVPDEIAAMVPHVTSSRLTLPFVRPDALDWDLLVRWNFLLEHQEERSAAVRSLLKLDEKRLQRAFLTLPKNSVDRQLAGHRWDFFQDCLEHDADDPHWASTDHSDKVAGLATPASFVGGWYDIFLQDQLRDFAATASGTAPHRLTIGPWTHASPAGIGAAVNEALSFAAPYAFGATPSPRAAVRLYVMGTGRRNTAAPLPGRPPKVPWRDFESWPPAGYPATRLHLHGDGRLRPEAPDGPGSPSLFSYDPADPTPSAGGPFLSVGGGAEDNRGLERRPDVLVFSTAELAADVEVIGEVSAQVWFASDRPSADVFVRLCDVDGRGKSINVCDGIVGLRGVDGIAAGPVTVTLWPTAYLFRKGHRIRIQVSSGSHPRYARNTGTDERRPSAAGLAVARQQVWHDADHPSAVVLPVAAAHGPVLSAR
jgi:putative CocE/NonD family hydrolase